MITTVLRVVWLTVLWAGLWGDTSPQNLVVGAVIGTAVTLGFRTVRNVRSDDDRDLVVRPLAALHFLIVFLWALLVSSVQVAITVFLPGRRIHTGIIAVPLGGASAGVATIVAGAVTLTPGTLTLEAAGSPTTLYIHALDLRDVESVRRDVRRFEVLAVRAFGDADALAGLDLDDSTAREMP